MKEAGVKGKLGQETYDKPFGKGFFGDWCEEELLQRTDCKMVKILSVVPQNTAPMA